MSAASQTPTIQLLQADWEIIVQSAELRDSVRVWTDCHPVLSNTATSEIIELVTRPVWSFVALRDEALKCLLRHCTEQLCQRMVLQSLLPQIIHIVDRSWTSDLDEQAALVVAVAAEKIAHFSKQDITCVHWWLYSAIKRQIERKEIAKRQQRRQEQYLGESQLRDDHLTQATQLQATLPDHGATRLSDLIDLIMQQGEIDRMTAEIVVLTRTGALTIAALASATGLTPETLRKKRLRAEKQLRSRLTKADFL